MPSIDILEAEEDGRDSPLITLSVLYLRFTSPAQRRNRQTLDYHPDSPSNLETELEAQVELLTAARSDLDLRAK